MITSRQINRLLVEFNQKGDLNMSAMKAGMTRKTAAKYLKMKDPQDPPRVRHTWRTRPDEFAEVWAEAEAMLLAAPELEAKRIFEHLQERFAGRFQEGHLRTFQRRVRQWRAMHGPAKEVHFAQLTQPGEVIQTDWTHAEELAITIAGVPYPHQLCHSVLIHSNWEWATRCSSESLLSLRSGIQAALSHLGRVPRIWQIDNSSTATHRLTHAGKERGFTDDFLAIAAHFTLEPRTINVGRPNENGDVESLNGHLKRRLRQHLLVRGSAEFASLEAYDLFLAETLRKANAGRTERVAQELALMRELPPTLLPDYQEYEVRVGWQSTIRLKEMAYSVPSRLIGQKLRARVSETTIEVHVGREILCTLPRRHGRAGAVIDFRHVIADLVRKPGAFARWRHRESLFPAVIFRKAYDRFVEELGERRGERDYLHLLKLAADTSQGAVEEALGKIMDAGAVLSLDAIRRSMPATGFAPMEMPKPTVCLSEYDLLLQTTAADNQSEEEMRHAS
ncbi:MAG: IS21 family transposase [Polynucleobacter sp.]